MIIGFALLAVIALIALIRTGNQYDQVKKSIESLDRAIYGLQVSENRRKLSLQGQIGRMSQEFVATLILLDKPVESIRKVHGGLMVKRPSKKRGAK